MTEERKLIATITPKLDTSKLEGELKHKFQEVLTIVFSDVIESVPRVFQARETERAEKQFSDYETFLTSSQGVTQEEQDRFLKENNVPNYLEMTFGNNNYIPETVAGTPPKIESDVVYFDADEIQEVETSSHDIDDSGTTADTNVGQEVVSTLSPLTPLVSQIAKDVNNIDNQMVTLKKADMEVGIATKNAVKANDVNSGVVEEDADESSEDDDKKTKAIHTLTTVTKTGFQMGMQGVQGLIGIVQTLYKKVVQSSEFLQTVENLVQLATTLLFMPLGNALAETILPATIDLVDGVLGLWDVMDDAYNRNGLAGILGVVLEQGLTLIGQYFENIGESLEDEEGLIGAIGHTLTFLGDFIENHLADTLESLLNITESIFKHFGTFIALYVGMETAQLGAMMGSSIPGGSIVGGLLGFGTGAGGTAALLKSWGIDSFAEGGEVESDGSGRGKLIRVAEYETEVIKPKSQYENEIKNGTAGGKSIVINNNFYGYNENTLVSKVGEIIDNQISQSKYRSGF